MMAKKKNLKPEYRSITKEKQQAPINKSGAVTTAWYQNGKQLGLVIALLVITAICFSPVLSSTKEFINFDDPVYVTKEEVITKLDGKHLTKMFTEPHTSLNYHPITLLSLAINYAFSGLHPFGYFFTNILFHALNSFLVFIFLFRLSNKKFWIGLTGALLFGIHPMHVESVAWASERKDVLYCFFFLASCITYLSYLQTKQIKYIIFSFVLFLLSCLSKAMAVPLPAVLLLIDFYKQRKFSLKIVAEKIPFFIVSLIIGYIAVSIQAKGAIGDFSQFTVVQRFMFASYGLMMYFVKLVFPVGLSAFYPYPTFNNGDIPMIYKIAPAIALVILAFPLILSFRNKTLFRLWIFGIGFFMLMIALVLQFLSVGAAIMADRYSYLPYIGLCFVAGYFFNSLFEKQKTKNIAIVLLIVITPALAYACYNRVKIWENDEIVWSDVIDKYPYITETNGNVITVLQEGVNIAYDNRANYYRRRGDFEKAFADYEIITRFHTKNQGAYNNMGNLLSLKAEEAKAKGNSDQAKEFYTKAIEMYSEAIRLKPTDNEAYYNRALNYAAMGDVKKALDDYVASFNLNPADISLLGNIGNTKLQLGLNEEGISDFNRALVANPNDAMILFYRGTAYVNLGRINEGISDLSNSVKINPALGNAWYNLSFALNMANRKSEAVDAALNARKNGFAVNDEYLNSLQR